MRKIIAFVVIGAAALMSSCGGSSSGNGDPTPSLSSCGSASTSSDTEVMIGDTSGNVMTVDSNTNSVTWTLPSSETGELGGFIMYYDSNGYPTRTQIGDTYIVYSNWDTTNNTVDVAFIDADGVTTIERTIAVDADYMAEIPTLFSAMNAQIAAGKSVGSNIGTALRYGGVIANAGICGAAIYGAAGTAGLLSWTVVGACASTTLTVTLYFAADELQEMGQGIDVVLTAVDGYQCTQGDTNACAQVVSSAAEIVGGAAETAYADDQAVVISAQGMLEGQSGALQFTLTWVQPVDMDLHVTDPNSEEIYFSNPTSVSGGELDVDDMDGGSVSAPAVENIFWSESPPNGDYLVQVKYYSALGTGTSMHYGRTGSTDENYFSVGVTIDGVGQTLTGTPDAGTSVAEGVTLTITTFSFSGS